MTHLDGAANHGPQTVRYRARVSTFITSGKNVIIVNNIHSMIMHLHAT